MSPAGMSDERLRDGPVHSPPSTCNGISSLSRRHPVCGGSCRLGSTQRPVPFAMNSAVIWLRRVDRWAPRRLDWLDNDERARYSRFLRPADRDLFLVAHTHLR